ARSLPTRPSEVTKVIRSRQAAAHEGESPDPARARTPRLEGHTGRPHDHDDRVLFESRLVGRDDLVKARNVPDLAGEHDLHELAGLANDLLGGLVAPLAGGVEHGEPVRKAGCDLAIDETAPIGFVHAEAAADVAAEH